eukprot:scaffold31531_cov35-Attheya_sp.AAC.3
MVSVVLAGTALSLQSAESCKSDLGKPDGCLVLCNFPSLCLVEIEQKLVKLGNLNNVVLSNTILWKLEGRGRLFGGLIPALAGCLSEQGKCAAWCFNGRDKCAALNDAIERHYQSVLQGLKSRIQDAYPSQSDALCRNSTVPRGMETLAIAALWGGTVGLATKTFNVDLVNIGLCSIEQSGVGGDSYVLSEELGRQAILEVAQDFCVTEESFSRVLALNKLGAGHAMEPLLVAELAMWCRRNEDATVKDFISALFDDIDLPSNLPLWVNNARFNVKKGCNKENRIAAKCGNDIEFILKAVNNDTFRDTLLSPTTVKRPDFEAVMGLGDTVWFLAASSKLYTNTFDDRNGNDLRSTQPSMFYCKKDGNKNDNCCHLKKLWDEFRFDQSDLFKQCLRMHCCIPDVKRYGDDMKRLWVENDGSIVLYITSHNIEQLFRSDSITILKEYGYL